LPEFGLMQSQWQFFNRAALVAAYFMLTLPRRTIMAKGQQRKTKEAKKPKKEKPPVA